MSELSTDLMTQVIVFHDGSHKMITEAQAALIFQASAGTDKKSITTPKLGMITFSSIAKVISLEDFYTQYPDKRPEAPRETFTEEHKLLNQVRQPTQKAMELMKKGFIQQRMYGNPSYTREQELLDFSEPRMTREEAEKELIYFNK